MNDAFSRDNSAGNHGWLERHWQRERARDQPSGAGVSRRGTVQAGFGELRCTGLNNSGIGRIEPEGVLRTTGYDQTAGTTQLGDALLVNTSGGNRVVSIAGGTLCGAGRIPEIIVFDVGGPFSERALPEGSRVRPVPG